MRTDRRASPRRVRRIIRSTALVLFLGVVAGLGGSGCESRDVLGEIRTQQAAGKFQESIEPLRGLLAERPDDPEINFRYGLALIVTGNPSLAEWSLRKAMQDPKWRVPSAMQLAGSAFVSRNFPAVLDATNSILEIEPENVEALMLRAKAYAHSKSDFAAALADCERIRELAPDQIDVYEPRILALLGLERYDEAGAAIEEMGREIEEKGLGKSVQAWQCATGAIFANDSQDFPLAEKRWADCLERFPSAPEVVWPAIKFYDERGEAGRSSEVLRAAVADTEMARVYRPALAMRLRREGKAEEAEALLVEGTRVEQPALAAAAWVDLVKHHQDLGQYAQAAEAAERAVELTRKLGGPTPQLLLEYADSLLLANEFERALAVADEMTWEPYREMIRGRVAQERGDPALALQHFDAAFRLWPDNPWARYSAAVAAEALGDFDRAIEEYRYSIRIDPGATDARVRIGRLLLSEGKPREALELLMIKLEEHPLDFDGELVSLEAFGGAGNAVEVRRHLAAFRQSQPMYLGRAAVAAAKGIRDAAGAEFAVRMLRDTPVLDLRNPIQADALRALVRFSHEAGTLEEAAATVRDSLEAVPQAGVFHEIHALALELGAAPESTVRSEYEKSLELWPRNAHALLGLGSLVQTGEPDRALSLFDRAAELDPGLLDAQRAAAEVLIARGDPAGGEARLEALLASHPYDAVAAARLAELQLERDEVTDRTLERARRAVRFGGGDRAQALLSRVEERLQGSRAPRASPPR